MSDELKPWEVLGSRDLLDASPYLKVRAETVRLPDGRTVENFYQLDQPDYALMYVETEDGRVVMLRTYKHGPRRVSLTFPAGAVEPGEEPLEAAKRELLEETGYAADDWTALGGFVVGANAKGATCHMFHAKRARKVAEPETSISGGDLEDMRIELHSARELIDAAAQGDYAVLPVIAMLGAMLMPELREGLGMAARSRSV
jgi:ADP-ribose pyrophosphatase